MTNHRVLIANHDAAAANRTAFTLRGVGYTVTVVGTSDEAIRISAETQPAMLIINPVMQGLSGFEAARHIVSAQNCKLLFLTNLAGDSDFEQLCGALGREAIQWTALPETTGSADLLNFVHAELGSPSILPTAPAARPEPGSTSPSPSPVETRTGESSSPVSPPFVSFTTQNSEPYAPIFSIATSRLYQANAFRLTGTQVTASTREIKRAYQEFTLNRNLGREWEPSCFITHLASPSDDEREQAFVQLSNPEQRLLQELFWFWADGDEDEVFAEVHVNNSDLPKKEWERRSKGDDAKGIASHNLAVLNHLIALQCEEAHDLSLRVADADYWKDAFRFWQAVIQNSRFWDCFIGRIRELDDPRVTPELAGRIWASLPEAILYINAASAVRAAESGDFATAARQRKLLYGSGLGIHHADKALDRALSPLLQHLTLLCTEAKSQVENDAVRGIEIIEAFEKAKSPLVKTLNCLVGRDDPRRGLAHDEAASAIRSCLIDYVNETKAWARALPFFENSLALAQDSALKARIAEDISVLQGNLEFQRQSKGSERAPGSGSQKAGHTTAARQSAPDVGSAGAAASGALRVGYAIGRAWKSMPVLGRALFILLIAALFVVLFSIFGGNDSTSSQTSSAQVGSSPVETPAAVPTSDQSTQDSSPAATPLTEVQSVSTSGQPVSAGSNRVELNALRSDIDESKAKLADQESHFRTIESEIGEYKTSIDSDKSTLEQMERDNSAGVDIDHDEYERIRRRHNETVAKYNAAIEEHNSLIREYHSSLAETNAKVDKYNSMVKSQ